jgi:hypothetical protein
MIPYILATIGGYLIGSSRNDKNYADGGKIGVTYFIGRPEVDSIGRFGKKSATWKTCIVDENGNKKYSHYSINIFGSAYKMKLDGIKITQKEFDKLDFSKKMAKGGETYRSFRDEGDI